jgi:hypothetical protein
VLGAGFALAGGAAAGLAAVLSAGPEPIGPGVWDDGQARTLTGVLLAQPFPLLVTPDLDGQPRTVFLASDGKSAAPLPAGLLARRVRVAGTLIQRGRNAMLAVERLDAADGPEPDGLRDRPTTELGEVMLTGEVLDAKCWFGAMRPAYGKTHKACASLCVRGGLPVAFCRSGDCGTGVEAPLFLDAAGNPHGAGLLPLVADPVRVQGHLVRVGDVVQLRAPLSAVRRI